MRIATESFRGEAPRVTPRELPENGAQAAVNARLQSGDLESWRQFAFTKDLANTANVRTIYLLNDQWLSWTEDVDVARGAIPGDNTFRVYLTGPDVYNQPRFTNYALATTGSEPFPVVTRPLGVPSPDSQPTLESGVSTSPSSTTLEVIDSGDQLTSSWTTSPPVSTGFTRSIASQDAAVGNGIPSYLLTFAENVGQPAYMYRDFGVGDSQVVFFSVDVMFGTAARRRMFIDALASATGAGIGIVWTEAGSFQIGIMGNFSATGFSALAGSPTAAPSSGIWYTVTVQIVRNAAGTKTVTATLYAGSAQITTVTVTNAFTNDGGNFGFVGEISEIVSPDPQTWYDNILIRGTSPTSALQQTATSYVYTFVNDLGEESAPSPPSATVLKDDGTAITVTTATSVPSGFSVDYGVTNKRIYRAVSGATGTVFAFVAEIPLSQADYVDELTDAELGDPLETELYALPPDDLRGILALPNGIMAGFRRNQICFSVQNRPHAWPVEWRLNTDTDVVGIGNIDTTLVIGTEAFPYLAIGNDPSAYSMTKLEKKQACVSKRSVAYLTGIGVVFASPDGIIAVSGNGNVRNLTETIFTRRQWQAIQPENILGVEHDDVYHFFSSAFEGGVGSTDPVVEDSATTALAFGTTQTITLPAAPVGDVLMAFVISQFAGQTVDTGLSGTGWQLIYNLSNGGSARVTLFAKVATGSDSLHVTHGLDFSGALTLRVSGVDIDDVEIGTDAIGSLDPPAIVVSGLGNRLWLAVACALPIATVAWTYNGFPAGYTGLQSTGSDATNKPQIGIGHKVEISDSEDPSAFTASTGVAGHAHLIVFGPGAVANNLGFALDMKETGFGLIQLGYHANALHSDPLTDNLYLVLTEDEEPTGPSGTLLGSTAPLLSTPFTEIFQFDAAVAPEDEVTPMAYRYKGKLNLLARPSTFVYCQIKAEDYDNLLLNLYADGVLMFAQVIVSSEPFTLPLTDEYEEFEFELVGTSRVRTAQFVEDIRELT